jgi:hypothetical protein
MYCSTLSAAAPYTLTSKEFADFGPRGLALLAWTASPTFPLNDEERPPGRSSRTSKVQKKVVKA